MNQSNFSDVQLTLFNRDNVRALVTLTAGAVVRISGLRVIEGKNGLFVAMPQRKKQGDKYEDVAYPISKELRDELQKAVLASYQDAVKEKTGDKK
jgi:stage V sporulation protein G